MSKFCVGVCVKCERGPRLAEHEKSKAILAGKMTTETRKCFLGIPVLKGEGLNDIAFDLARLTERPENDLGEKQTGEGCPRVS